MRKRNTVFLVPAMLAMLSTSPSLPWGIDPLPPAIAAETTDQEGGMEVLQAKPAVVRILDGFLVEYDFQGNTQKTQLLSSGSGFFINPDGYIVTNAHVVSFTRLSDEEKQEVIWDQVARHVLITLIRQQGVDPQAVTQEAFENMLRDPEYQQFLEQNVSNIRYDPVHHVITPKEGKPFPFDIKSVGNPGEKDVAVVKIEQTNAPTLPLGDSNQMEIQDPITILGYPGSAESSALSEQMSLEASVTDGRISAEKNLSSGAPVLQINATATHGSSGGPVLNEAGEVIGIVTFAGESVLGQQSESISFITPSSTIREFVSQSGTTPARGPTDTTFARGLELFQDRRYHAAIEQFEAVKQLYPAHPEVDRLINESRQAIASGQEARSPVLPIAIIVLGAAAAGGVIWWMKRKRAPRAEKPAPTPAGAPMTAAPSPDKHPPVVASVPSSDNKIEKYRKLVEVCCRGTAPSESEAELLETFRLRYDIPKETAEHIIAEVKTQATEAVQGDGKPYILMYRTFLDNNGKIDPDEAVRLRDLQQEMGLTPQEVEELERLVRSQGEKK